MRLKNTKNNSKEKNIVAKNDKEKNNEDSNKKT